MVVVLLSKGGIAACGRLVEVLQADTIAAVYGMPVSVLLHADYSYPIVLPLRWGQPMEAG